MTGDFYEEDEPVEQILADWQDGEGGLTGPPEPLLISRDLDDTYNVWWKREGEDEIFECRDLNSLKFIRRLIGANHNFGEITIVKVERSGDD